MLKGLRVGRLAMLGVMGILPAACAPSGVFSPIEQTPGPSIVIIGDTYVSASFTTHIPQGWRVITGPALSPSAATFAAPDGCWLIFVSADSAASIPQSSSCAGAALRTQRATIRQGDDEVIVGGSAPADQWAAFQTVFAEVMSATLPGDHSPNRH